MSITELSNDKIAELLLRLSDPQTDSDSKKLIYTFLKNNAGLKLEDDTYSGPSSSLDRKCWTSGYNSS